MPLNEEITMTAAIATDLPRTLTTGHVGLNVSDLDRSRSFYEQVFGFTTIGQSREAGRIVRVSG